MNHANKLILCTLALPVLLAGRMVLAEPADAAAAPGKPESASAEPKKCERGEEGREKRLETLKADLKLNASQEAAWAEWVGKVKGDGKGWEGRRKDGESWASLPAPERLEKMLAFSKEHIAKQEARLAATKVFYATLSPEQRQTFDKGFNFEHHGGFGRHWKR